MMSLSIYLHFYFSLKDLCLLFAILICHTRSSVCDCQSHFPRIWYFCCCCEQVLYFHYVLGYVFVGMLLICVHFPHILLLLDLAGL